MQLLGSPDLRGRRRRAGCVGAMNSPRSCHPPSPPWDPTRPSKAETSRVAGSTRAVDVDVGRRGHLHRPQQGPRRVRRERRQRVHPGDGVVRREADMPSAPITTCPCVAALHRDEADSRGRGQAGEQPAASVPRSARAPAAPARGRTPDRGSPIRARRGHRVRGVLVRGSRGPAGVRTPAQRSGRRWSRRPGRPRPIPPGPSSRRSPRGRPRPRLVSSPHRSPSDCP